MTLLRFADGKPVEDWRLHDTYGPGRQPGAAPPPGEPTARAATTPGPSAPVPATPPTGLHLSTPAPSRFTNDR
jgi:hypothetical protein